MRSIIKNISSFFWAAVIGYGFLVLLVELQAKLIWAKHLIAALGEMADKL